MMTVEITLFDGSLKGNEAQLLVDHDPEGDAPPLYAFVRNDGKHGVDDWRFWGASDGEPTLTAADRRIWKSAGCSAAVAEFLQARDIEARELD